MRSDTLTAPDAAAAAAGGGGAAGVAGAVVVVARSRVIAAVRAGASAPSSCPASWVPCVQAAQHSTAQHSTAQQQTP
jgi:hypothetical protein